MTFKPNVSIDSKSSVRAATTANITLSGAQTIDTISLLAGERVLVKDQTDGYENGIYVVSAGVWSRAGDADQNAELTPGVQIYVEEGSAANADSIFALTTDGTIIVGTTILVFEKIAGKNTVTKVGTTLDNQIAVWTGDGTIEGDANLVWNGADGYLGINKAFPQVALQVSGAAGTDAVVLVDDGYIITDATLGNVFTVTLAGNRQLSNPVGLIAGLTYMWAIYQDGSGSRTITFGSVFKFPGGTAPTLSATPGAIDLISAVYDGTNLLTVAQLGFS